MWGRWVISGAHSSLGYHSSLAHQVVATGGVHVHVHVRVHVHVHVRVRVHVHVRVRVHVHVHVRVRVARTFSSVSMCASSEACSSGGVRAASGSAGSTCEKAARVRRPRG